MKKSKNHSHKAAETTIDDPLAADLSDFMKEGPWKLAQFELLEKKNKVISLRISEKLLKELKKQATALGLDTQKFIRISLESIVRKRARTAR